MRTDIYEAVGALVHPLPDPQEFAAANAHLSPSDQSRDEAERPAERDEEFDLLLTELARCRAQILEMERRVGLLLAYGREFVRPQPYQLKDLASAAGLSISGVRIAYTANEVHGVEQIVGEKPRRPVVERRQ